MGQDIKKRQVKEVIEIGVAKENRAPWTGVLCPASLENLECYQQNFVNHRVFGDFHSSGKF